ncbi:hypothetical protein [Streptomyces sp. NPDC047014]|uniref:hypothetical protein n=1 Tax=Streptomyces sp. NPDC047014 TaxID=3155736 RepID=UPI0033C7521F
MTGRGIRSAAALAGCALLLTGCGIKTTGVIESGHAAKVQVPDGSGATLYYVSKDGRLVPTPFGFAGYTVSPAILVRLLMEGPRDAARQAGLTTELPPLPNERTDGFGATPYSPEQGIRVRLPIPVAGLSETARLQIVCTVAVSAVKDVVTQVTLQGTDTTLPAAECRTRS